MDNVLWNTRLFVFSMVLLPSVAFPTFISIGSIDGYNVTECKSNVSLQCSSTYPPLIVMGNSTRYVACVNNRCDVNIGGLGSYTQQNNFTSTNVTVTIHLGPVGIRERNTIFLCTHYQTQYIQPIIRVFPNKASLNESVNNTSVQITVTTDCVILGQQLNFVWGKTQNADGTMLEPLTLSDVRYVQDAIQNDYSVCTPDENCGGIGRSITMSFTQGNAGEEYYVHCTIVANDSNQQRNLTVISIKKFPFKVRVESVSIVLMDASYTNTITLTENDTIAFNCTSSYSRPKSLVYLVISKNLTRQNISHNFNETTIESTDGLEQTSRVSSFMPNRTYHNFKVYCIATNYLDQEVTSNNITLNIQFPPSINPMLDETIIEGNDLIKNCSVQLGNPEDVTIVWKSGKEEISQNATLKIINTTRDAGKVYACVANNTMKHVSGKLQIGRAEKYFHLNVLFPPDDIFVYLSLGSITDMNITNLVTITEDRALKLFLNCSASGNPLPHSYIWTGKKASASSVLEFYTTRNFSGNFTCHTNNTMTDTYRNQSKSGYYAETFAIDILYPPELNIVPEWSVIERQAINITCNFSEGNPRVTTVKWIAEGSQNVYNSSILWIENVNRSIPRVYTCFAENEMKPSLGNSATGSANKSVQINILHPPENISVSMDLDLYANHTTNIQTTFSVVEHADTDALLNCMATGNPNEVKYLWTSIDLRPLNQSRLLKVPLNRESAGSYICHAHNEMNPTNGQHVIGNASRSYTIDILYPPVINDQTNITALEGHSHRINCTKNPGKVSNFTVEWKWNTSKPIGSKDLELQNILRTQAGNYTCILNYTMIPTYGQRVNVIVNATFTLDVLYKATVKQFYILTKSDENRDTVDENRTVQLTCIVDSNPQATVEIKLGNEIKSKSGSTNKLDYVIVESRCNDTGLYTCYGTNKLNGDNTSRQTLELFVICEPRVLPSSQVQQNITTPLFKNLTLSYTVIAYPQPNFTWYRRKDSVLEFLPEFDVHNTSAFQWQTILTLENVSLDDFAEYVLNISNYRGTLTTSFFVEPDSPKSPLVTSPGSEITGLAAGLSVGFLLVTFAVVAAIVVLRKRNFFSKPATDKSHNTYENVDFGRDPKQDKRLPALPPPEEGNDESETRTYTNTQLAYTPDETTYLNSIELISSIRKIHISELYTYVTQKSQEYFLEEYEMLPKGLISTIPCRVAKRPENAPLNRYQGVYPYDHTRVHISELPDFFINANYINGFTKARTYIASLGPTVRHTLGFKAFWNMVWHEKSDVIVMLTNLVEPSGMKCEKYWADYGSSREIGDFFLQSKTEEITAEYTVRRFTVSKGGETRNITQLHYTAWPDKTVPESVTSLVEFRQRVKAAPTNSIGPLIVHCSAGIGRTGTYIALDRLIEEGKSTDSVSVYDCVMNMRKQRVNMVQTVEQYIYLHQALVYCLAFDIDPFTAEEIGDYIQTTSNNVYSQVYQQLKQSVEKESTEELEDQSRNGNLVDLNRRRADIPGDAHRVRLHVDKEMGESDYINAVYLGGFLRLEHFIIAQSPLPHTVDDFVGMLYQEKSCCIVALDDYQQKGTNNAMYVPEVNEQSVHGYFTISCCSMEVKSTYIVRKLKIGHAGKYETGERVIYHFGLTSWKHDERLPGDPKMFVQFIRDVEQQTYQLADEKSHVVVHCMNGSERSGLFCAVSNLIQKMDLENHVSVVNTLRRVRERRKTAIPTMEQLKFCYQAANAFVKSSESRK